MHLLPACVCCFSFFGLRISSCRSGPCIVVAARCGLAGFPGLGSMCLNFLYLCFVQAVVRACTLHWGACTLCAH